MIFKNKHPSFIACRHFHPLTREALNAEDTVAGSFRRSKGETTGKGWHFCLFFLPLIEPSVLYFPSTLDCHSSLVTNCLTNLEWKIACAWFEERCEEVSLLGCLFAICFLVSSYAIRQEGRDKQPPYLPYISIIFHIFFTLSNIFFPAFYAFFYWNNFLILSYVFWLFSKYLFILS